MPSSKDKSRSKIRSKVNFESDNEIDYTGNNNDDEVADKKTSN